jgi:hypothetical protein
MVRGIANLGVDPFFYFEQLHALAGMPPLIYTWRIDEISRQAAPFVEVGNMLIRDPTKLGWLPWSALTRGATAMGESTTSSTAYC